MSGDLFSEDAARARATRRLIAKARAEERARLDALLNDAADSMLVLLARMTTGDFVDMRDERNPLVLEIKRAGEVYDALAKETGRP